MTIQKLPGSAITPGTITVTQLESSVATTVQTGGGPKITAITVTNNAYTNLDDTAVSVSGGYIKITGTGFVTGCSIIIGSVVATSVSFISATEVRAQIPAQSAGTYTVYLVNPDGGVGIRVNGVNYSSTPSWTTTSPLPSGLVDSAISIQLAATSNSTVTYALQAGSTLPTGLTLSSAGLLSGTVTGITVDTTYNFTIVATDAELQDTPQAFAITITAVSLDAYYNLVSLHLKGDVATGGNLTVFSDASTNNFQLTTNGDVRGAAFSPYNTSWSVYFDGTGDNLSSSSGFVMAGDFTVECWMYRISSASGSVIISIGAEGTGRIYFYVNSSNVITYGIHNVGEYSLGNMAILNSWVHIAITRVSSTITAYVNGVATGTTGTTSGSIGNSTAFYIGSTGVPNNHHYGYISNLRVVNGTAVYTANFTPPTSPLTAVTNTAVLTCNSNRFRDSSTNNFTITRNGDSSVSAFSPFLETDTTTGSGYFDGTGDYLDVTNALFNPAGAFTIEFWFYPTDGATQYQGLLTSWPSGLNPAQGIIIWKSGTSGNDAEMGIGGPSTGYSQVGSFAWANCVNRWNHLVLVRNSSDSCAAFINGSRLAAPITKSGAPGQTALSVGRSFPNITNYYFQGYISNLHYVSGSSIYDPALTTISVPTVPIAKVANTALLTLQNRAAYNTIGFQDESEYQHIITRYGNAAQGTFSPFSPAGWSNLFNGSSGYISAPGDAGFAFGTDDFTIEMWVNITGTNAGLICHGPVATAGSWMLEIGGSTFSWQAAMNANLIQVSASSVLGTGWKHVAVTRASGTTRLFVDGGLLGSSSAASNFNTTTGPLWIGRSYNNSYTAGHISNVRVIKGQALYTGAFTPPANQLTATSVGTTGANVAASLTGTVSLLTCQSNRFIDNSSNNFVITRNGDTSVQPFSPFAPFAYDAAVHGGSGYFDGTGDYLSIPANAGFQFDGDFTVECWFYSGSATTAGKYDQIVGTIVNSTTGYWRLGAEFAGGKQFWFTWTTGGYNDILTSFSVSDNAWHHLAVTRVSNSVRLFVDGIQKGSTTTVTTSLTASAPLMIMNSTQGSTQTQGYVGSLRIIKGTALYTSNFIPPSGPLPLVNNTSLLLNFTNAGIIDSTGKNVIETVGNAGVVTAVKKYGTGSIYFDGTGDYLNISPERFSSFGTSSFTVEFWMKTSGTDFNIINPATATGTGYWALLVQTGSGGFRWNDAYNVTNLWTQTATSVLDNNWHHIAIVRNGTGSGNVNIYFDGVAQGTAKTDSTNYSGASTAWRIGSGNVGAFNGYIQDLRITPGIARYTANFTAPTKAFADQGQASTAVSALAAPTSVDYLVVAGGGGGGSTTGGGGGAGGFRTGATATVSSGQNYIVTVGAGGAGGIGFGAVASTGGNGSNSSIVGGSSPSPFASPGIVSTGGGGGGAFSISAGQNGGSGGGGSCLYTSPNYVPGGTGNTPSTSPSQGSNGGNGQSGSVGAGGGGGASAAGATGSGNAGGNGGAGSVSTISGASVTYAGGGGGGGQPNSTGGTGGGGAGVWITGAESGTANTGGGGGGTRNSGDSPSTVAGAGGSGIVIIAYPTTFKPLTATLGLTYTVDTQTRSGYRVYKFLGGTGSISW